MSEHARGPAYRIHTERLVIRCWDPKDASLLQQAFEASVEHLKPWMPWAHGEPEDLEGRVRRMRAYRAKFDLGQDYYYGILNREETEVLGACGLHIREGEDNRHIGYWIHAEHTNKGLATECAAALTKIAFEIDGVDRVEIHCDPRNVYSAAIPAKLGYTHEATLRRRRPFFDERTDVMIWTLFADEYRDSEAASVDIEAFDVMDRRIL
jgi:RimJ/RimL family protein N-acetyltransferase